MTAFSAVVYFSPVTFMRARASCRSRLEVRFFCVMPTSFACLGFEYSSMARRECCDGVREPVMGPAGRAGQIVACLRPR